MDFRSIGIAGMASIVLRIELDFSIEMEYNND
jgi:hypothetical protein